MTAAVTPASVLWSLLGECGFILALFVGSRLVPGPVQPGAPREDGTRILYRMNSLALFMFTLLAAAVAEAAGLPLAILAHHAWSLLMAANLIAFPASAALMLTARSAPANLRGWFYGVDVLVPFFYSMPAAYVAARATPLPLPAAILLTLAFAAGWWMFRGANQQKHRFKQDKAARIWGRPARTLGGRLLVSGFWGIGRKLNYTGELTMYIAWICLAGLASAVPFVLPLFLATLLVHRALRDDLRCRAKYGLLWDKYCRHARFRMVPFA